MSLRVMLIDQDTGRAAILEQALRDQGHEVVARLSTQDGILARVQDIQPDIIIIDMESPDRDTLESLSTISRDQPRPIVMFAEQGDSDSIESAVRAGVSAYIVDGLNPQRLKPIMDVAIARFREYQALRRERDEARSKLADRVDIDRAKAILMKTKGLSEDQAYHSLRKLAMDRNLRLGEAARAVIAVSELL